MISLTLVMKVKITESLEIYFSIVDDERHSAYITYELPDILFLLICGLICGCTDIERILEFGEERLLFFKKHTNLKEMPCLKTLNDILAMINPNKLEICLYGILRNVFKQNIKPEDKQICIDGKTVCSTVTMSNYEKPLHVITALLADSTISLGQIVVDSKSNEIPAVKELVDIINIKDAIITMDAMHCQKETVKKIISNKGDYVVQLKANQGNFYEDVYAMFDDNYMDMADKDCEYETYSTIEKGHGRIEKRTCYVLNEMEFFTDYLAEWEGLKKIFAVKRVIEKNGITTTEISCYLSSKNTTAENLLAYTRKHWQVESFHWLLDVNLNEDNSRVRNKNSQVCLNVIRKYAISILKKYIENNPVKRKALSSNMYKCLLNTEYLESVLNYYCNF